MASVWPESQKNSNSVSSISCNMILMTVADHHSVAKKSSVVLSPTQFPGQKDTFKFCVTVYVNFIDHPWRMVVFRNFFVRFLVYFGLFENDPWPRLQSPIFGKPSSFQSWVVRLLWMAPKAKKDFKKQNDQVSIFNTICRKLNNGVL